jgi:putative aminopeptidase FrvX
MNVSKLHEVLSIQSTSNDQFRMFAYLVRYAKNLGNDVSYYSNNGNLYITKGKSDTFPCVVAHMDTVHDMCEDLHPIEYHGNITGFNRITMEQTGIGGDDKVGIFIALQCLERFPNIKIAFFRDEEIGCQGSYLADMNFFEDCRYVLQCDRRGNSDFIIEASGTPLSSKQFRKAISNIVTAYQYKFERGMMTDVMALKQNGIKCSVANISCGYYRPHCADEYVNINDVENCFNMVASIIQYVTKSYPHTYQKPIPVYSRYLPTKYPKTYDEVQSVGSVINQNDYFGRHEGYPNYTEKKQSTHCKDCWAVPVLDNGYCSPCSKWYQSNEVIF